jgi:hypothetical protein
MDKATAPHRGPSSRGETVFRLIDMGVGLLIGLAAGATFVVHFGELERPRIGEMIDLKVELAASTPAPTEPKEGEITYGDGTLTETQAELILDEWTNASKKWVECELARAGAGLEHGRTLEELRECEKRCATLDPKEERS